MRVQTSNCRFGFFTNLTISLPAVMKFLKSGTVTSPVKAQIGKPGSMYANMNRNAKELRESQDNS